MLWSCSAFVKLNRLEGPVCIVEGITLRFIDSSLDPLYWEISLWAMISKRNSLRVRRRQLLELLSWTKGREANSKAGELQSDVEHIWDDPRAFCACLCPPKPPSPQLVPWQAPSNSIEPDVRGMSTQALCATERSLKDTRISRKQRSLYSRVSTVKEARSENDFSKF